MILAMVFILTFAFLGTLLATRSFFLAFCVLGAAFFIISGLGFFVTVLMSWEIGLVEAAGMVYFTGYALGYSLHIACGYASREALQCEPPEASNSEDAEVRSRRTRFALKSTGGAALGSAAIMSVASFILSQCSLSILRRFGGMCLAVALLSVFTALGPLPAFLLWQGPLRPGHGCMALCRDFQVAVGLGSGEAVPRPRATE